MATMSFTLAGERFDIDTGRLTAIDARDFRAKIGTSITSVFASGTADLDALAGLIWLVKRKRDPSLTFEKVATSLTYDTELSFHEENGHVPEVGPGDPEI